MSDHFTRIKRVGIVEEDQPGVFKDAFDAAACKLQAYYDNTEFSAEQDNFERPVTSTTFAKDVDIISRERGTIRARAEIRGAGGTKMTIPSTDPWLRSCATERESLKSFALDPSGSTNLANWRPGIKLTQDTTGATAYIADVDLDDNRVLLYKVTGTPDDTNDWQGTSSAGTFALAPDSSAPADYGIGYHPTSVGEVYAQGTLSIVIQVSPDETITIGDITYTFKSTFTPAAYEVMIGLTVADTQANLVAAINGTGTEGVEYAAGTLQNPKAKADPFVSNDSIITAKQAGAIGNTYPTTTTMVGAGNEFDGTTLGTTRSGEARHFSVAEFKPFDDGSRSTRDALKGAVGDAEISADNIGQPMVIDFTLSGVQVDQTEVTTPTGISYERNRPLPFNGVDFKITGEARTTKAQLKINAFRFRFGNQVETDESCTAENGLEKYDVVGRSPGGEMNPRLLEPSVKSFFKDYKQQLTGRKRIVHGTVEGKINELIIHKSVYGSYGHEAVRDRTHARLSWAAKAAELDTDSEWWLIYR